MEATERSYQPEWVNDYRRYRRWLDARTVLARVGGDETLGKTVDLSLGGMKVDLRDAAPPVGQRLEMAVVFGDRVVDLGGTVLYRSGEEESGAVGLEFDQPLDEDTAGFLRKQYPPAMEDADLGLSAEA